MSIPGMTTVYPPVGGVADVAKALLDLADNPLHVQTTTDTIAGSGHLAFVVPQYLADRFVEQRFGKPKVPVEVPVEAPAPAPVAPVKAAVPPTKATAPPAQAKQEKS